MDRKLEDLKNRKTSLFTSSISGDKDGEVFIVGKELIERAQNQSLAHIVGTMWLGRELKSKVTEELIDIILKLVVDNGPYVSGAVNTMISSRAGKDLVSSLVSGLLTIGPRFGGAINGAAKVWFEGVNQNIAPASTVEDFAKRKEYIQGIGHRKYRVDIPEPRVKVIKQMAANLKFRKYLEYALEVEKITTSKKPNLILNVDGTIAAVMMDVLTSEENLSEKEIESLIKFEFFNAFFVLGRTVGFIAHFIDQKRLGEKMFRLKDEDLLQVELD